MKRLTLIILALITGLGATSRITPEALLQHCRTGRASMSYRYTILGSAPVHGSGELIVEGGCFRSSGNGVSIYCDSHTIWTVDEQSGEVYVEDCGFGTESMISSYLRKMSSYKSGEDNIRAVIKDDKRTIEVEINGIRMTESRRDTSSFRLDTSALDAGKWIITDLRVK